MVNCALAVTFYIDASEQVTDLGISSRCVCAGLDAESDTKFCDGILILVNVTQPMFPDVVRYIVNCSDNTCSPATFEASSGELTASPGNHTVNVYAVNRCNQIGPATSIPVTIQCNIPQGNYM